MSLQAFIWACDLPLNLVNDKAFRVLLKLANCVDKDGRNAFPSVGSLAEDLGCSVRTVQRALSELERAGLIEPGDQRLVNHVRRDRRPRVFNLTMGRSAAYQPELSTAPDGVTDMSRGDRNDADGVTTVVALRSKREPVNSSTQSNHTGPVTPCPGSLTGHGPHQLGSYGKCIGCYEPWGMLS